MVRRLVAALVLSCAACASQVPSRSGVGGAARPPGIAPAAAASLPATASLPAPREDEAPRVEVQEHHLDAMVEAIEPLGTREATVWPVDVDPRFVVVLRLHGVTPDTNDRHEGSALRAGQTVAFAIHSPSRVFARDAGSVSGKRFRFRVTRTRTREGVAYSGLRVEQ